MLKEKEASHATAAATAAADAESRLRTAESEYESLRAQTQSDALDEQGRVAAAEAEMAARDETHAAALAEAAKISEQEVAAAKARLRVIQDRAVTRIVHRLQNMCVSSAFDTWTHFVSTERLVRAHQAELKKRTSELETQYRAETYS